MLMASSRWEVGYRNKSDYAADRFKHVQLAAKQLLDAKVCFHPTELVNNCTFGRAAHFSEQYAE